MTVDTGARQAGDIVAQLKAGIALKCTVVRDGSEQEVEARDLVPGDILILEEGETIAADAKVSASTARVSYIHTSVLGLTRATVDLG